MEIWIPLVAVILGGLLKGFNGFGYALVSTSILAAFIPAQEAVAIMIIPLIAGNLELALESDKKELKNCLNKFSGFLVFLVAGVTAGMVSISLIPSEALKAAVGIIALVFAASRTQFIGEHLGKLRSICFRTWEPVIGFFSGAIYGASNVGVLIVAYLKSRDLTREKFISTLAVAVLSVSIYRVLLAQKLGLYTAAGNLHLSLLLSLPAVLAVKTGEKLSVKINPDLLEKFSVLLIAVIGVKLLLPS